MIIFLIWFGVLSTYLLGAGTMWIFQYLRIKLVLHSDRNFNFREWLAVWGWPFILIFLGVSVIVVLLRRTTPDETRKHGVGKK